MPLPWSPLDGSAEMSGRGSYRCLGYKKPPPTLSSPRLMLASAVVAMVQMQQVAQWR